MYLLNRCPTRALANQTPFEAWSGRKPSVNHLKIFGCVCYAQIPKEKRQKLDETSEKCIFIGYSSMSKGYKLYNLKKNKTLVSRDVIFDENATWNWKKQEVEKSVSVPVLVSKNSASEEENQPSSPSNSPQAQHQEK